MALTTKLNLINAKFYQQDGGLLTLSGDTRIHDVGTLQYTSNQSGTYVARSVPDVAYVTGLTGNLDGRIDLLEAWSAITETRVDNLSTWSATTETRVDNLEADVNNLAAWSGTTQNAIDALEADVDNLAAWSGTTNTRLNNLEADVNNLAVWSGTTETRVDNLEAWSAITETRVDNLVAWSGASQPIIANAITNVTNGLTKVGAHGAQLGGQLTGTTTIYGSQTLNFNVNTVNITGYTGGIRLSGVTYIAPMVGTGNLLCFDTITGQVGRTSLSAFGGITGGTNGITDVGDYNLGLGGVLCDDTVICGGGMDFTLGTAASKLDALNVCASGAAAVTTGSLSISSSGATFTDLCSTPHGIIYGGDYSNSFCNNSLVSKIYVDTIATGLVVHNSVCAATTVGQNLDLSGVETIDGITTTNGMRILVKNQTDASQNGIYTASATTWTRSTDMDWTPSGEITNGDLVPVTSGSTQNNSIWVITSPNPIDSGDTITFTEFATVIDMQGGAGIDITQVGGLHTVCVNLGGAEPTSCGLSVGVGGLCVDPNIAGHGLSYSAGVLNADVISGGSVSSIPVRYNAGDTQLVINCADITAAVGALTGAESGLHVTSGNKVALGGVLTGATTITGSDTCTLTYTDTAITNKRGILYGGDYSATFVSNSLVSAKYVTGLTSNLDIRIDDLEADVNNLAVWSGTTNTRLNNLEADVNNLAVWSGTTQTAIDDLEADVYNLAVWSGTTQTAIDDLEADVNNLAVWSGTTQTAIDDLEADVNNLAVWSGATQAIVAVAITGVTNGLTKVGAHSAKLGGTITETTTISGAQALNFNVTTLSMTGTSAINLNSPSIVLTQVPPAGSTADSVLVRDSTGQIQVVAGSVLGDHNNIYSYTAVTGTVALLTGSSYVVLATAPATITLPSPAQDGQVFKIKDAAGTALTTNISIVGTIDGAANALINTNYGALELMYSGGAWYSLAFIN